MRIQRIGYLAGITEMVEREGAIPVIAATTADRLDVFRMALDDRSVAGTIGINVTYLFFLDIFGDRL